MSKNSTTSSSSTKVKKTSTKVPDNSPENTKKIRKVQKRDGRVVDFDPTKIERALGKAFDSVNIASAEKIINSITNDIVSELDETFADQTPHIESIQDVVEKQIAKAGFFEVSRSYILYREKHKKLREEREVEKEKINLRVLKRSGDLEAFDLGELEKTLRNAFNGMGSKTVMYDILEDLKRSIFDGITTDQITKSIIFAVRARIETDPVYSKITARIILNSLYKNVIDKDEYSKGFEKAYRGSFKKQILAGIKADRLDDQLKEFDFKVLSEALVLERDKEFEYLGIQTIQDRYFVRDSKQNLLELPQYFWMRVAMGLALNEKKREREQKAIEFYNLMSQLHYVPSTPTLLHSGLKDSQMSSCYLMTVEDDLNHIFKSYNDQAHLAKWSGGLGIDWTNVRSTGAMIKTINVPSQGVIPFLKICDTTTASINRSGKRRGAAVVYLEPWHFDVESFLELRKNTGDERRRTHDTNTSLWIPDLFMKRVQNNENWTLFSPDETPELHHIYGKEFERKYVEYEAKAAAGGIRLHKTIKAADLWRKMITMLFETGHPWMTFKDPCNIRSPQDHVGVVHSSNLCTEITLNTSKEETAVCNLGSVNLSRHVTNGELDREKLEATVKLGMRMLDNVIDLNFYPTKEAKHSNFKHRPVGLGIMGLQDALYQMDIIFDSEAAVQVSDTVQEFISYHAILASSELAKERGTYSTYKGSKWSRGLFPIDTFKMMEEERGFGTGIDHTVRMDWTPVREHVAEFGMRNSNCMAIAPTATISNISGCYPSIEPIYRNLYVKSNMAGEFSIINKYLIEDLKKLNLWNKRTLEMIKYYDGDIQYITQIPIHIRAKYKGAFEIDPHWVIRHAAFRTKWIDQSQSINLFVATTQGKVLSEIYTAAWAAGLKTTYYLRTLGATAIEKSTISMDAYKSNTSDSGSDSRPTPQPVMVAQPVSSPQPVMSAPVSSTVEVSQTEYSNSQGTKTVEVTEVNVQTAMETQPQGVATAVSDVCRLDDPTCESCQ